MARREIILIDEEKCDGCGLCVTECAEGALKIVAGKAKLVSDTYCDGLGACLKHCPNDALKIVVREAPEFDEAAAMAQVGAAKHHSTPAGLRPEPAPQPAPMACGCPGSMIRELKPLAQPAGPEPIGRQAPVSALRNWPLQLHLVPTRAPFYDGAGLLIAADCTGFSLTALHRDFLPGRSLIIACPKLDETASYQAKLAEIFRLNQIKEITVLYMTVPCCTGLVHLVRQALAESGRPIPLRLIKVDFQGAVVEDICNQAA